MNTLRIFPSSINMRAIDQAVDALRDGQIILYPTDTLYALGCDALNNRAIEHLCAIKGINPQKQMLSVVCANISQAAEYAYIDNNAFRILRANLPGPFTFVLPAATTLPKVFKGRKTVGIRVPDNPITQALAEALGHPVLSASVDINPEYPEESANPDALEMHYADIADLMIDGGDGGYIPSAIIDLLDSSSPEILRDGPRPLA